MTVARAPTIVIHGVSNYAREGAPEPETVTVAKITRPGTPETASPAVEGPNKTRIEPEGADTRHPCAMAGPKQTEENVVILINTSLCGEAVWYFLADAPAMYHA